MLPPQAPAQPAENDDRNEGNHHIKHFRQQFRLRRGKADAGKIETADIIELDEKALFQRLIHQCHLLR